MKTTKGRLKQIIKEELQRFSTRELHEEGTSMWELYDRLEEALGTDKLLVELIMAMPSEQAIENMELIARENDIDLGLSSDEGDEWGYS